MRRLLKAGYSAVKACSSSTQVALHIAAGGDNGTSRWWFDGMQRQGVQWDVTAESYYCFWHGSLSAMQSNVADLRSRYGKPVIIAETSYPFTTANADSQGNVITSSSPCGYPATWAGQANAFAAILNAARAGGAAGVFYWDRHGSPHRAMAGTRTTSMAAATVGTIRPCSTGSAR